MERETDRLRLRPTRMSDAPALFAFLGDAAAMRHTHSFADLRACRRHLAGHEWQRRRRGYAPWTVIDKAAGAIVGWGGLLEDPFDPGWGIEVGYWFASAAWGKGYATELVRACLAEARDRLHLSELRAFVRPGNAASQRVLEKAGLVRQHFVLELERYLYSRRL